MSKTITYILLAAGLVVIAIQVFLKNQLSNIPVIGKLSPLYILGVGLLLIVIGAFLGKNDTKQLKEVPIYEGKKIVGYRRQK